MNRRLTLGPVTIPGGNGSDEATDESSKSKGEQLALLGLVVTVAPIVFGGIRILSVSGGNVDTLRALVQNLDVVALGLGTILPFAASILLWFVILTFGTAASPSRTKDERNRAVATILVLAPVVVALTVNDMSLTQRWWNAVIIIVGLILVAIGRWKKGSGVAQGVLLMLAIALIAGIIYGLYKLVVDSGMWLPRERVTLECGAVSTGYVLSADEVWTKYMTEDNVVHIVKSDEVARREIVGGAGS